MISSNKQVPINAAAKKPTVAADLASDKLLGAGEVGKQTVKIP